MLPHRGLAENEKNNLAGNGLGCYPRPELATGFYGLS